MTTSEQIIQVLDALCAKFGIVIDWTSENVVPYLTTLCTKLVSYELWTSVAWMAIFGFALVFTVAFTVKHKETYVYHVKECTGLGFSWTAWLTVVCFSAIVVIIIQTMDIIKCVTFPEMYIFEYAKCVLNSGG